MFPATKICVPSRRGLFAQRSAAREQSVEKNSWEEQYCALLHPEELRGAAEAVMEGCGVRAEWC